MYGYVIFSHDCWVFSPIALGYPPVNQQLEPWTIKFNDWSQWWFSTVFCMFTRGFIEFFLFFKPHVFYSFLFIITMVIFYSYNFMYKYIYIYICTYLLYFISLLPWTFLKPQLSPGRRVRSARSVSSRAMVMRVASALAVLLQPNLAAPCPGEEPARWNRYRIT